jgi:hypothetical protein
MTLPPSVGGTPIPKETARVLAQEPKAADRSKHTNLSPEGLAAATGPAALLVNLSHRFAEFNHSLLALPDGQLLLSSAAFGGVAPRMLPDLRSALLLLKQWEGR